MDENEGKNERNPQNGTSNEFPSAIPLVSPIRISQSRIKERSWPEISYKTERKKN
jgi:hypothetical protein